MARYFIADIGGTSVKWALVENDEIAQRGLVPTAFASADELIDTLVEVGEGAAATADPLDGVGVSVPGSVYEDDPYGTVHRGGALPYMDGCPLAKRLRERFGVPAAVSNDGKCCALGEYAKGALRGKRFGVVLAIGTGIGGGIVIDGHVLRGAHSFAGEFSFLSNDLSQNFDIRNAFATTCGWMGLRSMVLEEKGMGEAPSVDGRVIFEWIANGDKDAQRGLDRYAEMFDRHLVNLQTVLDPEVFAIAGGISCHPELLDALKAQMPKAMSGFVGPIAGVPEPKVVAAELGNDANIFGAALECERLVAAEKGM